MIESEFNNQLILMGEQLNRYALQLTANKDDAKDLLQDTFLKAFMYRHQFRESTNLHAWVHTIMKNTFINNYRRSVRQNTTFDSTGDFTLLDKYRDIFNNDPDSIYSEKEIYQAINRLENYLRVPFLMYFTGYTYEEVATNLGIKLGTVKSRLFFARKQLMKMLQEKN